VRAMDITVAVLTSGVVAAIVAGFFKLWSDVSQSRRNLIGGVSKKT